MLRQFLRAIRFRESSLMLGFPLMGLFAARPAPERLLSLELLGFLLGTFFLSGSVYAFNSWGGLVHDRLNHRLQDHPLHDGSMSARRELLLSLGLLGASLVCYALWAPALIPLGLGLKLIWVLYSNPRMPLKGAAPFAGTALHLIGGTLQALLGYTAISGDPRLGLSWCIYFALIFTAGHFFHEVLDWEADRAAGQRTVAIVFGPDVGQRLSALTFGLAYVYLVGILLSGAGSLWQVLPFWLILPLHAWFLAQTGCSAEGAALFEYQRRYRLLFGIAGAAMAAASLLVAS
jgi:4-hydroxybenzoate polyprenyltransferase